MSYGDNVSRISDLIKQSQETPLESIDENESTLFSKAVGKAQKKATEYTDKWDTIKEKGDEELAGVLGIEIPLKGYKKAKSLYKKYKDAKEQLQKKQTPKEGEDKAEQPEEEEDPQGFGEEEEEEPEVDSGGGGASASADVDRELTNNTDGWVDRMKQRLNDLDDLPDSSTATLSNPITDEPLLARGGSEALESDVTTFGSKVLKAGSDALDTLKSGLGKVGDFVKGAKNKLFSSAGKDAGKVVGKEVGEDEAVGVFDSVVGGIPLLGEGALAITGLISLGRAFAHLFKHKKQFKPQKTQLQGVALPTANTQLTQKYSMGLPSIDSASEVSASFSAF